MGTRDGGPRADPCDPWLRALLNGHAKHKAETTTGDRIAEGARNATLASLAGTMRRRGMTEGEIAAALLETNRTRCQPPLSEAEVRAIAASVGRYKPADDATAAGEPDAPRASGFTSAGDLLAEPDEAVDWLVDGMLPAGGLSVQVAKPKVGKSTSARTLAVAVAQGAPFLGRPTAPGPVLYVALEEKRADVRRHLRTLGVAAGAPLHVHTGAAPDRDPVAWLRDAIQVHAAVLVVLDPLGRFLGVKDLNDYAQVTRATAPLIELAHETRAHIHATHHGGKGERDAIDASIGSTAITGSVDTIMVMRRHTDGIRSLETIQRTGTDLPETVLLLDETTGAVRLGGDLEGVRVEQAKGAILAVLDKAMTEDAIRDAVRRDNRIVRKALRELHSERKVARQGTGGRGNPYTYGPLVRE